MPFGLYSAPATFQKLLNTILGPELESHVLIYFDNIIIVSATFEEHLQYLVGGICRRDARLRLNQKNAISAGTSLSISDVS